LPVSQPATAPSTHKEKKRKSQLQQRCFDNFIELHGSEDGYRKLDHGAFMASGF